MTKTFRERATELGRKGLKAAGRNPNVSVRELVYYGMGIMVAGALAAAFNKLLS